jgi:sec-independent protein translocase protein TatA
MFTGLESPTHLLLILLVVLLLFGAKRLPELGRNLGQAMREFKGGINAKDEPEEKGLEAVEGEREMKRRGPQDTERSQAAQKRN